jgi:hypothetical protein
VLNENWRGTYDILVTIPAQDSDTDVTGGLVDANFVAAQGAGGISLAQLEQIRAISGVEVAAPIGMVGSIRRYALIPSLVVTKADVLGESEAQSVEWVLQTTATLLFSDAAGDDAQPIAQGINRAWLQVLAEADSEQSMFGGMSTINTTSLGMKIIDDFFALPLASLPAFSSSILAVDPIAEMQLLGDTGAAFLAPLLEWYEAAGVPDDGIPDERIASFEWADYIPTEVFYSQSEEIQQAADAAEQGLDEKTVVPMVVSRDSTRELSLQVEVALADKDFSTMDLTDIQQALKLLNPTDFVPYTTIEADVSSVASPFVTPDLTVLLREAEMSDARRTIHWVPTTAMDAELIGRPSYEAASAPGGGLAFEVVPQNVVEANGFVYRSPYVESTGMEDDVGKVRAYRSATSLNITSALSAPLGYFSLEDIADFGVADVSYVPVGYSSAVDTWQVTDSGERVPVLPNLSNLDFITTPPGAFTDLEGGAALRGETPIDAIRIRVADIASYTPESQAKIANIAAQIELLGLQAVVVAGSSPQSVSLFVPDYYVDKTGDEANLGWVSQEWSTPGAAVTVETALTSTVLVLTVVAVISGAAGFTVSAVTNAKGARSAVRVLREVGWRKTRILRQLLRELAPASLLITAASVGSLLLGEPKLQPLFIAALAYVLVLLGIEVWAAIRPERTTTGTPRKATPLVSLTGIALRLLRNRANWVSLLMLGTALVGVLATLSVTAVQEGRENAGATRLSQYTFTTTGSLIVTIGALGVGTAVLLLFLAHQAERHLASSDAQVFTNLGFTPQTQTTIARKQDLFIAAGSTILGIGAITAITLTLTGTPTSWLAGTGALLLVIVIRLVADTRATVKSAPQTQQVKPES